MESLIDPRRCRVWSLHNRLDEHINESTCAEEIQSFKDGGQRFAAIGRPTRNDPEHDIEIIIGARRLFVAGHLNQNLLVDVRDISDTEAIVLINIENRQRKDMSLYEWGIGYARWLRAGCFKSQGELALALNVSNAKVSRLLKLAHLPTVILNAFGDPANIREGWGEKLTEILGDPVKRQSAIRTARAIAADPSRPRPQQVYRQLLSSAAPTAPGGHKIALVLREQVIEGKDGMPLFRIRHQQDQIALLLPIEKTSARTLRAIQYAIERILTSPPIEGEKTSFRESGDLQVANA